MLSDSDLVERLHCYYHPEEQNQAIEEILKRDSFDLSLLLRPMRKMYWEHAALVLSRMNQERLLPIMDGLFEWIQDLNWPGAQVIRKKLGEFPKEVFMPYYEKAVIRAIAESDYEWLGYLSWFILENTKKVKQEDFVDKSLYERLLACKDDFWL